MSTNTSTQTTTDPQRVLNILDQLGYSFTYNELSKDLLINGQIADDDQLGVIRDQLRRSGFNKINVAEDAIRSYAFQHAKFNPLRDYINSLTYNGGRHIEALASHFSNPDGMFPIFLKRFLIGSIRRILTRGEQNLVLVLDGPQRIGKSQFARWLVPSKLQAAHFIEGPINPESKDDKLRLLTTWIWEVAELGATTRKADVEALKSFISTQQIRERKPYGKLPISGYSNTSFIATVNSTGAGILNDPSGSRRFMFTRLNEIDWKGYTQALTPEQIWAEAAMLYVQGEPAELTEAELQKSIEINENYETETPVEDLILDKYSIDPSRNDWEMLTSDIEKALSDQTPGFEGGWKGSATQLRREINTFLVKQGCEKFRKRISGRGNSARRGFYGIRRNP